MVGEKLLLVDPTKFEGAQRNQKKLQMKSPILLLRALSAFQYTIKKEAVLPKIAGGRKFKKTISLALLATPASAPKIYFTVHYHKQEQAFPK